MMDTSASALCFKAEEPSVKSFRCTAALVLLAFCLLTPTSVNAQVAALRVDQPSPTAASLGKFGDIPVSLYTGTPSINVPLHTVRGRTMSVPVSLSYHASGVKVEEIPGWVGAGWALNAGGVITRTVRALPDDGEKGFMNTGDEITKNNNAVWDAAGNTSVTEMLKDSIFNSAIIQYWNDKVQKQLADPEPDQFFFNFGGRSGQFFFTNDGTIRMAPHQKLQIIPDVAVSSLSAPSHAPSFKGIPGWTIITEDGMKYRFGELEQQTAREYSIDFGVPCNQCASVSAWYLLEIASATGDETITFSYSSSTAVTHDRKPYKEKFSQVGSCSAEGSTSTTPNQDTVDTIRLEEISSDLETVTFVSVQRGSTYMTPGEFLLQRIEMVNDVGVLARKMEFTYSPRAGNRLFLDSVQEFGANNESLPAYVFEYESGSLPDRLSPSADDVDHWGYYNAAGNGEAIPEVIFEDGSNVWFLGGANKEPNPDVDILKRGTLKKITYPTGGFTEFTYESHDYGYVGTHAVTFAWFREPEVYAATADETVYTENFSIGPSLGGADVPVHIKIDWEDDGTVPTCIENAVECMHVRLLDDAGTSIYTFNQLPDSPGVTEHPVTLNPDATYTLELKSHANGGLTVWLNARRKVSAVERQAGGLRIQQIRSHDGRGNEVVKTYAYDWSDSTSTGVLVYEPQYFYVEEFLLGGLCLQLQRSIRPVTGLGLTQGSPIGYEQVKVLNGVDESQGYTIHRFTTANLPEHADEDTADPIEGKHVWSFAARTSKDFKRGRGLSSDQFDAGGNSVQREVKGFLDWDVEQNPPADVVETAKAISFKEFPAFYFKRYEVISSWSYVQADSIQVHGATTLTRNYEYDPDHLQLTKLEEENNDGRVRTTGYEYAHKQYSGMAAANMLSQVYRQTVYDGGTTDPIVQQQQTTWREEFVNDNSYWRPDEEFVWDGTGFQTIAEYVEYDDYGRILRQQDALGREVTFEYQEPNNDDFFLSRVQQGNLEVKYEYYDAGHKWGLLHKALDENDNATTYDYDHFRRLEEVTTPLGGTTTIGYDLDAVPNIITTTTELAPGQQVVSKEYFDGLGRPFLSELEESANSYILTQTEYDSLGRVSKTWKPIRNNTGGSYDPGKAGIDYGNNAPYVRTLYFPDPLNRVSEVIPEGNTTSLQSTYGVETVTGFPGGPYAYVETTDEDDNVTRVYTDAFGHQVRTEAGVGTAEVTVTEMDYDILGNLVAVKPPNYTCDSVLNPECESPGDDDWKTSYEYDARSLLVEKNTPDTDGGASGDFHYTYDAKGNLRFVIDPRRQSGGFLYTDYDQFDRVVETGLCMSGSPGDPDASTSCTERDEEVVYTYDDANPSEPPGGLTINNPKGHLTQVVFDGGYYQYSYDNDGRVEALHVKLNSLGGKLIRYDYDLQGNVTKVSYQADSLDALYHWYDYDGAGRLEFVETNTEDDENNAVQEARYSYTATGQVDTLRLGDDHGAIPPITYEYHIRDWLTKINDPDSLNGNQFAMRLRYDEASILTGAETYENGNVASIEWVTEGNNIPVSRIGYTFEYDALNRLTLANYLERDGTGWDASPTRYEVPSVVYDPNGNITQLSRHNPDWSQPVIDYTYFSRSNRLKDVTVDDTTYHFLYDANGNMTKSRVADPIVYDRRNLPAHMTLGGDQLLFRYDADGQRIYKQLTNAGGEATTTFYLRGVDGRVLAVYTDDGEGGGPQLQYWNILSGGAVIGRIVPASGTN